MSPDRKIAIRRLTTDDYDAIRDIWVRSGLTSLRLKGRDAPGEFARQMESGCQIALGAELDGKLVGVVLATHDGRKGWINRLAVDPEYRRRGIAKALIAEAERVLREEKGMRIIAALIEADNEPSLELFQSVGYHLSRDIYYLSKRENPDV